MIKKFISLILSFAIVFSLCSMNVIGTNGESEEAKLADKKYICDATLEDDFADDCVIVVVNRSHSKVNKKFDLSSFPGDYTSMEELSKVEDNGVAFN